VAELGGVDDLARTGTVRIAVFGGAYSNPYALRALLNDAGQRGCRRVYCLGDLGGFGAEPEALWPLLVDGRVQCIAGNYDVAIGRGDDNCGCGYRDRRDNEFAQVAYDYTRAHTSPAFAAWMRSLPHDHRETIAGVDLHMVHGSPIGVNDFFWESLSDNEVTERLEASGADIVLCTHSGLPWVKRLGGRTAVNVGVIGRPANDGRREVWYAVVDLADGQAKVELVDLHYDWAAQAASVRAAGLPEAFADTIETGWWTTCLQVLPGPLPALPVRACAWGRRRRPRETDRRPRPRPRRRAPCGGPLRYGPLPTTASGGGRVDVARSSRPPLG